MLNINYLYFHIMYQAVLSSFFVVVLSCYVSVGPTYHFPTQN